MNQQPTQTFQKYRAFAPVSLPDRTWPNQVITKPPTWCSVDLRDGNQALIEPMDGPRKLKLFLHLVAMGYKEIEVGFPAASQTDFDFVRQIIEQNLIPADVTIQVLTQAREDLIARTFESLVGARCAIVHLYNSTSTAQRRVVFRTDREGVKQIAVQGAKWVLQYAAQTSKVSPNTEWVYEYSPESFTGTELDFAQEICDAVADVLQPSPCRKLIVNLPATVEHSTPNVYADMIEWMHRHLRHRKNMILSVHPHNDRGCGVAAAELAVMAGAERVEGCLFGNGERTGNVCLVTLGLNLHSQGIDPGIDFSDINASVRVAEECTQLPVHPRHPYAGELVFTAFSGSHQDAIKKGLDERKEDPSMQFWDVPYLPIDPADLGRTYDAVIRVNSQSGKGGMAYLLERDFGLALPRLLQVELSQYVQEVTDKTGKELSSAQIKSIFDEQYLQVAQPFAYASHQVHRDQSHSQKLQAQITEGQATVSLEGRGNGPMDAMMQAIKQRYGLDCAVMGYSEHGVGSGQDAQAVCYVQLRCGQDRSLFGVGADSDIEIAALKALLSGINRALARQWLIMRPTVKVAA